MHNLRVDAYSLHKKTVIFLFQGLFEHLALNHGIFHIRH